MWRFRLVVRPSRTAKGRVSATRRVTATRTPTPPTPTPPTPPTPPPTPPVDSTAPGPVTGLTAVKTGTTVTLSWTNPTDADFTGAVIRRALGNTAPATVTAGSPVTDTARAATSFTNTGLDRLTRQYSYAVFAHDGVPNYAAAANVTTNTAPIPATVAVLSVKPLGVLDPESPGNNKLTVSDPSAFDASGSLAADGTTLASGTLAFGDGETFAFTQPFGPLDFWNTVHSYTTTGPQTVTLTVVDSAGGTATDTVTVDVFAAPTASVSVSSSVARDFRFALAADTPTGTVLNFYFLEFSPQLNVVQDPVPETFRLTGTTAPPASLPVNFTIPGSYTVRFIAENDAGGSAEATINIVVP